MVDLATACASMHVPPKRHYHRAIYMICMLCGPSVPRLCCTAHLVSLEVTQPLTLSIRPDAFETVSDSHPIFIGDKRESKRSGQMRVSTCR
jgi:ribosomal protein L31